MFRKTIAAGSALLAVVLASAAAFGQSTAAAPTPLVVTELPIVMRQNVTAGKTPVGTKVQANLAVATLVNDVVIPREALLSGEVVESVAKTKTVPSRLSIRMDSAQWKNGSAPIRFYLTAWYYPAMPMPPQALSYQPADAATSKGSWNGMGAYPDRRDPAATPPFPRSDPDSGSPPLPSPSYITSKRHALMKNVETLRDNDGAVTLTSSHDNLKLDKLTTYVVATWAPPKN
ncbi:MAG: hypothetical protein WCF68_14285 [Terriglobales bacterium]